MSQLFPDDTVRFLRKDLLMVLRCCVFSLLWLVLTPYTSQSQERFSNSEPAWHFEFDLFQMLFEEKGLRLGDSVESALREPEQSVLIYLGDTQYLNRRTWLEIQRFVREGGALLVASDTPATLSGFGRFMHGPVTTSNPSDQYQGFVDCLRIRMNAGQSAQWKGISELVTNRSSWFVPSTIDALRWETLASLPRDCLPSASRRMPLLLFSKPGVNEASSQGNVILAADASIFTNGMMWHGDNAMFAIRTSEILCSEGKNQFVFVKEGIPLSSYRDRMPQESPIEPEDPPMEKTPEPQWSKLLRLANAVTKEVEESNLLNEALRDRPRKMPPERYFRGILFVMMAFLVFWVLWKTLTSKTLKSVFMGQRPMKSAYELRTNIRSDLGDYRNAAGYLAREFCWEVTQSRLASDWQPFLDRLLQGTTKVQEKEDLTRVFDIASRGTPHPMTNVEFQLLGKTIQGLRAKHRKKALVSS